LNHDAPVIEEVRRILHLHIGSAIAPENIAIHDRITIKRN
jgi:hypothetical protein